MGVSLGGCKTRVELVLQLAKLDVPLTAVEVGVAEGRYSAELLRFCPKLTLHMVDPWLQQPLSQWNDGGNRPQPEMDDWYRQALVATEPYADRRVVHRGYSVEVSREFQDQSLDLVYLDGNHAYTHVRKDIAAWWPKIKAGGILAGHDYTKHPDAETLGVIPAVQQFAKSHALPVFKMLHNGDSSWAMLKPNA